MNKKEKNRILKLHKKELLQEKGPSGGALAKSGTNTSSSGQYEGNAFVGEGPLTTSGRGKDIGSLPIEVDITKGSEGLTFNLKNMDGEETNPPQPLNSYIPLTPFQLSQMLEGLNSEEILSLLGDIYGLTPQEILDLLTSSPYWDLISGCISKGVCGGKTVIKIIISILGPLPPSPPVPTPEDNEEINKPLSLSCCKKCDNGMYTNKCFPFDSDEDEDCRFPTLEVCEDESDPKLPSMLDIFS